MNPYISQLQLKPHPEGGYFRETYRSAGIIPSAGLPAAFSGARHFSTAIYFLLQQNDFSAFHRIRSDECWHFYDGDTLLIHEITPQGKYKCTRLGRNIAGDETLQHVVPADHWFASEPAAETAFALVGCTVAPGFDFADFEMAKASELIRTFPQHETIIKKLCRE